MTVAVATGQAQLQASINIPSTKLWSVSSDWRHSKTLADEWRYTGHRV